MKPFLSLLRLELYFGIRRSGFLVFYVLLFGLLFLMANAVGGAFPQVQTMSDGLKLNAPVTIQLFMGVVTLVATFLASSIATRAALRDYRYNVYQIAFTYPVSKTQFLAGKFLGAYIVSLLLFTAAPAGFAVGCEMPWLHREAFLPFDFTPYLQTYLHLVAVNLFVLTGIFFALGVVFRNIVVNWTVTLLFYVLYFMAETYLKQPGTRALGALMDPYGLAATESIAIGFGAEERNTTRHLLTGLYLNNRLLWTAVGMASVLICSWRFRFAQGLAQSRLQLFRRKPKTAAASLPLAAAPAATQHFGSGFSWRVFSGQLRFEVRQITRSATFYIILAVALAFLYSVASTMIGPFGSIYYPITRNVTQAFGNMIQIFLLLVIMIFSGESVWRDTQHRISGITGSMPAPRRVTLLAKTFGLYLVVLALLGVVMLTGIIFQLSHDYHHFEPGLYVEYLFGYLGVRYLFFCVLAIALQTLAGNKYGGYAAFGGVYLFGRFFAMNLFRRGIFTPGHMPAVQYSDLLGFNGTFYPFLVYFAYWLLLAILLWQTGARLYPLSDGEPFRDRMRRFRTTTVSWSLGIAAIGIGGFIFYNNDVLNENKSEKYQLAQQARYEKTYGSLQALPKLRISRVEGTIDMKPSARSMQADLQLTLVNRTATPIDRVYLHLPEMAQTDGLSFSKPWKQILADTPLRFRGYRLSQPVAPGDSILLSYRSRIAPKGFNDEGPQSPVRPNGTFLNNANFMPTLGYDPAREIAVAKTRRSHGLPPRPYAAAVTDPKQRMVSAFNGDRIWLKLTLITDKGQTAIAPGYLQRRSVQGDRASFTYVMDQPAINFFSIQSGRYAVKTEAFRVPGDPDARPVQLSVYYHAQHGYNLDYMMQGLKDALTYYTKSFGPYQYRQLRIVEFPESAFAQSFANTIPFSENVGFLDDLRGIRNPGKKKAEDIPVNSTYYVVLHEVGHQWWAHQILPANTEGAQMLSETMANYSAIAAIKDKLGPVAARKLLEHSYYQYLSGRSNEQLEERPLSRVLFTQSYICYGKGMCVFYTLQKYLGIDRLNGALHEFVSARGMKDEPYATSDELVSRIRALAPDSLRYLVSDGLEQVVLYQNLLQSAEYKADPAAKDYVVSAEVVGKKLRYNAQGLPAEVPMSDYVEIGVLDSNEHQTEVQVVKLHAGRNALQFHTAHRPVSLMLNPDYDLWEKDYNREPKKAIVRQ